jgi:hypothetical protein
MGLVQPRGRDGISASHVIRLWISDNVVELVVDQSAQIRVVAVGERDPRLVDKLMEKNDSPALYLNGNADSEVRLGCPGRLPSPDIKFAHSVPRRMVKSPY